MSTLRINVEKRALGFYSAKTSFNVGWDSPYRSMFTSFRYITRWARSPERAKEKVIERAQRIMEFDREWRDKKRSRTTTYEERI